MADNGKYRAEVFYQAGRFHVRIKTVVGSATMWAGWIKPLYEVKEMMIAWGIPVERVDTENS